MREVGVSLITADEWYDKWFGALHATGTVSLHFDANLTKFTNLVRPGYVPDFRD